MSDYSHLAVRLAYLNDAEVRLELGEDARRAELSARADTHLANLVEEVERLRAVLWPKAATDADE